MWPNPPVQDCQGPCLCHKQGIQISINKQLHSQKVLNPCPHSLPKLQRVQTPLNGALAAAQGQPQAQRQPRKARLRVSGMLSSSRCSGEAVKGRCTGKRWLVSTRSWPGPSPYWSCSRLCGDNGHIRTAPAWGCPSRAAPGPRSPPRC